MCAGRRERGGFSDPPAGTSGGSPQAVPRPGRGTGAVFARPPRVRPDGRRVRRVRARMAVSAGGSGSARGNAARGPDDPNGTDAGGPRHVPGDVMTRDEAIARAREMNDDGPPFPGGVAVVMHRGNDHW